MCVRTGFSCSPQWTRNGSSVSYNPQIRPILTWSYHANVLQFWRQPGFSFAVRLSCLKVATTVYYACIATAYDEGKKRYYISAGHYCSTAVYFKEVTLEPNWKRKADIKRDCPPTHSFIRPWITLFKIVKTSRNGLFHRLTLWIGAMFNGGHSEVCQTDSKQGLICSATAAQKGMGGHVLWAYEITFKTHH